MQQELPVGDCIGTTGALADHLSDFLARQTRDRQEMARLSHPSSFGRVQQGVARAEAFSNGYGLQGRL